MSILPSADPFGSYLATNQQDSWAYLQSLLDDYGLGSLAEFAKNNIIEGRSDMETMQRLRETPEYKKRFAVIEERKKMGLPAISESEVVSYEKEATQMMRAAGLPSGFYDSPEDFYNLQLGDVSISELQSRIDDGYNAASQAAPEVRDNLEKMYGIDMGGLAAFFLDPDKTETILKQKLGAAQRGAVAQQAGYGQISSTEAERLYSLNISEEQARQGFGTLANSEELFSALPGENTQGVSREQQFGAAFEQNAQDSELLKRRTNERKSQFANGTQYTAGKEGASGLGTAR